MGFRLSLFKVHVLQQKDNLMSVLSFKEHHLRLVDLLNHRLSETIILEQRNCTPGIVFGYTTI